MLARNPFPAAAARQCNTGSQQRARGGHGASPGRGTICRWWTSSQRWNASRTRSPARHAHIAVSAGGVRKDILCANPLHNASGLVRTARLTTPPLLESYVVRLVGEKQTLFVFVRQGGAHVASCDWLQVTSTKNLASSGHTFGQHRTGISQFCERGGLGGRCAEEGSDLDLDVVQDDAADEAHPRADARVGGHCHVGAKLQPQQPTSEHGGAGARRLRFAHACRASCGKVAGLLCAEGGKRVRRTVLG